MSSRSRRSLSIKYEEDEGVSNLKTNTLKANLKKSRTGGSKPRQISKEESKQVPKFPKDFDSMWEGIRQMRAKHDAPVDSMGAALNSDKRFSKNEQAFQTLVGLILSAQTRDGMTHGAMLSLINERKMTLEMMSRAEEGQVSEWIRTVNFRNQKAKFITKAAKMIMEEFEGVVPSEKEDILKLPGVGHKMANLLLQHSFGKIEGISVDTHMHRICNRLKWVKTKTPNDTMTSLESWLPREKWVDINELLVGFGQTICKPVNPMCYDCKIKSICPYTPKTRAPSKSSKKKNSEEEEDSDDSDEEEKKEEEGKEEQKSEEGGESVEEENEGKGKASEKKLESNLIVKKRKLKELEAFKHSREPVKKVRR